MTKLSSSLAVLAAAGGALAAMPKGIDVSHYQGTVDFNAAKSNGVEFVYMKATEGLCKFAFMRCTVAL